jgi:hypothetical protein
MGLQLRRHRLQSDAAAEAVGGSKRPVNPPHLWALNFPQF